MSTISRVTTWSDNQTLTASALNGEFNNILNDYNGSITNANISAAAGLVESKITFSGSGHGHTGGADGKLITVVKNFTYGAFIPGSPAVANDLGLNPRVRATATATRISAYARTAPTGSDMIVRVFNITQGVAVATLNITAGSQTSTSTGMTTAALAAGDYLRFDITQIGSTINGSNITVQIDGTE